MVKLAWIICCDAQYDDYTYCYKPKGHDGPHLGAWWKRKKDGTPDRRYRYNVSPDKEWGNVELFDKLMKQGTTNNPDMCTDGFDCPVRGHFHG